jgi:7,8-dihydro-6-hydroxymethylpterin dimethyltransferase
VPGAHRIHKMKIENALALRKPPEIDRSDLAKPLREALQKHGLWTAHQTAARRWPIGCISLEVTQRCNLDCTLCYLSEHSEAVHDFPLEEIFRRIDLVFDHYGRDTDIQISGGDPTLRDHDDLEAIVRYIKDKGMRSSLFTNGILATRALLARLAGAGMTDVAFHVDLTQERKGFESERALNAIRSEYIERARGLNLSVFFNTSIYADNVEDVPMLARFFAQNSDVVRMASFQMQAQTGRGVLDGTRAQSITQQRVMAMIEEGAGTSLNFDALIGGSPTCNRYATALTFGRGDATRAHDLFRNGDFIARVMRETADLRIDRTSAWRAAQSVVREIVKRPRLALQGIGAAAEVAWRARADLHRTLGAAGGVQKISYFIHNFMDASALEQDRLDTCVFMAATQVGPVPMCEYNANRDAYLLRTLTMKDGSQWQPVAGRSDVSLSALAAAKSAPQVSRIYPIKFLKGRARDVANAARAEQKVKHALH